MKKKTCFVMLAALMMAGCSNEVEEQVMDSRRVPLQINGDINMLMTRAADDHWDANDAIGVYMVSADNSIVGGVSNYRYVVIDKDNGNFSPDGETNTAYFPESDDVVNVVAYYPQGNVVENKLSLDLANQDEQPRIDLMSAKAVGASKSNPNIKLEFKHRLTKLFFEIEGDVNTDGIYAAIDNQYTDIQYDILNDKLLIADGSEKKDIVMKYWNLGNYRFTEAIVLPNGENNSAEDRELTFQLNEKIFKATISNSTTFEAGKKYTYKVKFETTPSGNITVSITGVSINNWDAGDISDGNIIVPGTLKFDRLYLASGFTDWQQPYEMTKSEDGKTFTWTGNVQNDNQEMKFALLQQSLSGDVQLMPNMSGTTNKDVALDVEMDAYPVIYYDKENAPIKRDNKWVIKEKGTYTVTVNVETMKVKVEKLDVVYLVGSVLSVEGGENPNNGYDLKRAPYFTKIDGNKYELTINLHEGEFKILSKIEYDNTNTNYDYYAPGENTPFEIGNSMNVAYRQANDQDYKWQVTEDQTGTYKLTLDVSNSSNVTLTAEKL